MAWKKVVLRGDNATDEQLTLTEAEVAVASDSIAFVDSDGYIKKDSIVDFTNGIAGTNITASSGTLSVGTATASALGVVKLGSGTTQSTGANAVTATASRTYAVQLNGSDQMVVNVPWSDTNTVYTHPDHSGQVTSSGDGATELTYQAIYDQTSLGAAAEDSDVILILDVSDTTDNANGTLKKVTRSNFVSGLGAGTMSTFVVSDGTASSTVNNGETILLNDDTNGNIDVRVTETAGAPVVDFTLNDELTEMTSVTFNNAAAGVINMEAVSGTNVAGQDIFIKAGVGTGTGDPGAIVFQASETVAAGATAQTLATLMTISNGGVTISGDLTVTGDTTTVSSTNTTISDQFISLNEGGASTNDAAIIVDGVGAAFGWNNTSDRLAAAVTGADASTSSVSWSSSLACVIEGATVAAYEKPGNIRIDTGAIYIYV